MKIFYCARMARPDLLAPINRLSRELSGWDERSDQKLHKLMMYIYWSLDRCLCGFIGSNLNTLSIELHTSTTGVALFVRSENGLYPPVCSSKKQKCAQNSTTEAELVALNYGINQYGIPTADLWSQLLGREVQLSVFCDNSATVHIVTSGKNQSLRYLHRVHSLAISQLHEKLNMNLFEIQHVPGTHMLADGVTKIISGKTSWATVMEQLCLEDQKEEATKLCMEAQGGQTQS